MIDLTARIGVSGALGATSAYLTNMNPISGALFGVIGRLINEITKPIFDRLYLPAFLHGFQKALDVGRFILLTGLTAAACTALGFPLTFSAALVLQISQLALTHLVQSFVDHELSLTPAYALTPAQHYYFSDKSEGIFR